MQLLAPSTTMKASAALGKDSVRSSRCKSAFFVRAEELKDPLKAPRPILAGPDVGKLKQLVVGTALAAGIFLGAGADPSLAAMDTNTYKAGAAAKIESSDLRDQSPQDIVKSLKEQVVPQAEEKLGEAADRAGGNYPKSVVQELKTVKGEIEALEKQLEGDGPSKSVVKSTASGIEQQVNALKAMLGFD